MELLTVEEVLKIFEEDGCYLSDPKDYKPGMFIDETSKTIRESILSDDNNDVEETLKELKELDKFERRRLGVKEAMSRYENIRNHSDTLKRIGAEYGKISNYLNQIMLRDNYLDIESINKAIAMLNDFSLSTSKRLWEHYTNELGNDSITEDDLEKAFKELDEVLNGS